MGTNFYAKTNECHHCDRADEIHIGKSSAGWKFLFNPYKETWKEWKGFLKERTIVDEYGMRWEYEDLRAKIEHKQMTDGIHPDTIETDGPHRYLDPEGYFFSKHKEFC